MACVQTLIRFESDKGWPPTIRLVTSKRSHVYGMELTISLTRLPQAHQPTPLLAPQLELPPLRVLKKRE
jgi:hypothetical protein